MTNDDKKVAKSSLYFECSTCDYITSKKSNYDKHRETKKHKSLQNDDNMELKILKPLLVCLCGKEFNHRQNLWMHKKKCSYKGLDMISSEHMDKADFMKQIFLQNQQLIFNNQEFKNMIVEIIKKPATAAITNNNTNCHNTNNSQFNLQFFLNENCKNAMNMTDFINSIEIENDDLENMGKLGYVQGISNIFIKNLKNLDECIRPMHCNDLKREILYIKENNVWDKDENKKQVKHAIAMIAHKNFKYIPIWTEENPQAFDGTTKKNDQYMRIANQVATAITPDDDSGINKIIRNVSQNVVIDKSK
jgi:hypothetical protein